MATTLNIEILLKWNIFFCFFLILGLMLSSASARPPVLARVTSKPSALKIEPNPVIRQTAALSREGVSSHTSPPTRDHSPTLTDISSSPLSSGRKNEIMMSMNPLPTRIPKSASNSKEATNSHWLKVTQNRHKLMMLARSSASQKPKASSYSAEEMMAFWSKQAKLNPKLTRPKDEFSKKEPSNQSQASRDQKFKSPQDSDVGPSVRSNYYPNTPQSMAKVPENHAMEQKQEEPSSPFPIPFSRRPPKITKELPASHWLKVCRNRHRLKFLNQSSPSQARESSLEEQITSFWSNLAKSTKPITATQEELSRNESKTPIGRDEKLKSIQDPDVGPSNCSNYSHNSPGAPFQISEGDLLDRKQKGPCTLMDATLVQLPGKNCEHSSTNLSGLPAQGSSELPVNMIQFQASPVISPRISGEGMMSTSETSSSSAPPDRSTLTSSEKSQIARMQWRKTVTKVKTLNSWGFFYRQTVKADVYVFKVADWFEKVDAILKQIQDFFEGWAEFESLTEVVQMYLNARDRHQLDPFAIRRFWI